MALGFDKLPIAAPNKYTDKMKFDLFGRGFPLRLAITVGCEMAFILFGIVPHQVRIHKTSANADNQATIRAFSLESSATKIS